MRSNRWVPVLVVCLAMASPLWAIAEGEDPTSSELEGQRLEKFFDYALCAVSLAAAPSGLGLWVAGLTCGRAVATWWSE